MPYRNHKKLVQGKWCAACFKFFGLLLEPTRHIGTIACFRVSGALPYSSGLVLEEYLNENTMKIYVYIHCRLNQIQLGLPYLSFRQKSLFS